MTFRIFEVNSVKKNLLCALGGGQKFDVKKLGAFESVSEMILLYETFTFRAVADPTWSNIENLKVSIWLKDISNL